MSKKSGVKLQYLTEEGETTFGSSYHEVRNTEGLRNRDSSLALGLAGKNPF